MIDWITLNKLGKDYPLSHPLLVRSHKLEMIFALMKNGQEALIIGMIEFYCFWTQNFCWSENALISFFYFTFCGYSCYKFILYPVKVICHANIYECQWMFQKFPSFVLLLCRNRLFFFLFFFAVTSYCFDYVLTLLLCCILFQNLKVNTRNC